MAGSFAYQKHFDWSPGLTVEVDTSEALGSRCTAPDVPVAPASSVPHIGPVLDGKGNDPVLTLPIANNSYDHKDWPADEFEE